MAMYEPLSAVLADKGPAVYAIEPGATVVEAVRQMNEKGIGALLVLESDRPVGIFTERDVLRRVVDAGLDPRATRVRDVMTVDLLVVGPSTRVEEAMAIMTNRRLRHLPVMDGGRLLGMVSIGDLTRWVTREQQHHIEHLVEYITGRRPG
jgi:CBS domain-containing protein